MTYKLTACKECKHSSFNTAVVTNKGSNKICHDNYCGAVKKQVFDCMEGTWAETTTYDLCFAVNKDGHCKWFKGKE